MKDFISILDLSREEIYEIFERADYLKENKKEKSLLGKTVITSFPATSLRTRVSFETGIFELGGNAINMDIKFDGKERLEDKVGYLNCWIDMMVIRNRSEEVIRKIAEKAEFKVINAMSANSHPCEILSDVKTLIELKGNLENQKIVFVGEGANISNTWFQMASKLNLNITQVCPEGYEIADELYFNAKENSTGEIVRTNDLKTALKNADIILTDGWPVCKDNPGEYNRFLKYQINNKTIELANKNCILNPCPPFTIGNEVTKDIINSKHFIGYKAKENLLHVQKGIMSYLKNS